MKSITKVPKNGSRRDQQNHLSSSNKNTKSLKSDWQLYVMIFLNGVVLTCVFLDYFGIEIPHYKTLALGALALFYITSPATARLTKIAPYTQTRKREQHECWQFV